jgi:type IV secretion system protein TrbL
MVSNKMKKKTSDNKIDLKNIILIIFLGLVFFSSKSMAATPSTAGILDSALSSYSDIANTWANIMVSSASWLFWGLVLISMVWTYGMMALRQADAKEFFAETIRFFGTTGFFWWILKNGPAIAESIINTMKMIGGQAAGTDDKLSPSGIVDIGIRIFFNVIDNLSTLTPIDDICGLVLGGIILYILTRIGVNMLILLISGWILAYGGVFFLGFGGARWTSDIAINYYKTILGLGTQLMGMILIIGIGTSFINKFVSAGSNVDIKQMAGMFVAAIVIFELTEKIPPMLAGIVSGGAIGGSGIGGAAIAGAAGMAMAAATTGGTAVKAGASQIAGGASALKAAFQSAQQSMASGSGGNGLSGSIGTAGKFAADMGSSLAKGLGDVVKNNASSSMDSMKENIGQTFGGKMASAIRNSGSSGDSEGSESSAKDNSNKENSSSQSNFSGDGLSAGSNTPNNGTENLSKNEEVVDFVNKGRR